MAGQAPHPYVDDELRKVATDAYVSWQGSRYLVPWSYAGCQVWVREHKESIEVHHGSEKIAVHEEAQGKHSVVRRTEHHEGIPMGARREVKTLVHLQQTASVVEIRSLAAYERMIVIFDFKVTTESSFLASS